MSVPLRIHSESVQSQCALSIQSVVIFYPDFISLVHREDDEAQGFRNTIDAGET